MNITEKFENLTLKGLRKLSEKTAAEVAEHIGTSAKTYHSYEADPYKMSLDTFFKVAQCLEVEPGELLKIIEFERGQK